MDVSRRTLIAAIPLIGCAGEARAGANVIHIAPDGAGDGSSWATAASFAAIADLIAHVEPGGEILLAADRGAYEISEPVEIAGGGRTGLEVRIRGVGSETGAPMAAVIRGEGGGEDGTEAFKLMRGASHLKFSHFDFRALGNGAFRVAGPLSNLTIEDCAFEGVYRFFENTAGNGEGHASLDGLALRRCAGTQVERGFMRLRYNSRNAVIEDCSARGVLSDGGRIPVGCALDDRASNVSFRRCVMENFQQSNGSEYWNGDGFSDEPGNTGVRYEACVARGSTDGGFDCKSRNVVLEHCVAEDNKRNFRIWSDRATLSGCVSRNPNFRGRDANENASSSHIWIGGEDEMQVRINDLTIEDQDATPIIEFNHQEGRVAIQGVTITSPRLNWGADAERIRGRMLLSPPQFRQNMANESDQTGGAKQ